MQAVTWFSKYVSLGAFIGAIVYVLAGVLVLDGTLLILLSVFTALLVIIKHIPAIYRISKGQEEKFRIVEDISYKLEE